MSIFAVCRLAAVASLVFLMGLSSTAALADGKDPVRANVDGVEIRASDIAGFRSNLPPAIASQIPDDVLVQQLVGGILMARQAKADGLDKDDTVKRALADAERQILVKIWINKALKGVVTDEAIKARYEQAKSGFVPGEEVHARHILVASEAEAKDVLAALKKGKDFAKLAKEKSMDPSAKQNGGDLGYFGRGETVPEFAQAAFAAKSGTLVAEPVQTQFGWHVIKVDDKRTRKLPTLEESKPEISRVLAEESLDRLVNGLMETSKVTYFDANGKPMDKPVAPAKP